MAYVASYFRCRYASFMRQVNGWGFKRIVSGNDHNSYYHELFVREYPQLCLKMKRIKKHEMLPSGRAGGKKEENTLMELPPPSPSLQMAQQQAGMYNNPANILPQGAATAGGVAQPPAAATMPLVNMAGANGIPNLMGGLWNPLAALTQGAAAGTLPNALSAALGASMPPATATAAPSSSAPPSSASTSGLDAGAALAGLGQLDSSMLARLQEALSSGNAASLLQGQAVLGQQVLSNGASAQANTANGNNAAAQLLAAQLQAASQPVNVAAGVAPSANAEVENSHTNGNNEVNNQQAEIQPPSNAAKAKEEVDEDNEDDNGGDDEDDDEEDSNDDDDDDDDDDSNDESQGETSDV